MSGTSTSSPHDPTLGLSAAQRAALQRLERVSATLTFVLTNVNDLAKHPELTFQCVAAWWCCLAPPCVCLRARLRLVSALRVCAVWDPLQQLIDPQLPFACLGGGGGGRRSRCAANQPNTSVLSRDAEVAWELDWENRHMLSWLNRPHKPPPCVATLSLSAARKAQRGRLPKAPPADDALLLAFEEPSSVPHPSSGVPPTQPAGGATTVAFCGDGSLVAAGHTRGVVSVWNVQSTELVTDLVLPVPPLMAAEGKVAGSTKRQRQRVPNASMPEPPQVTALAFNPANRCVAVDGVALVWLASFPIFV